jgi:hypothetical protein
MLYFLVKPPLNEIKYFIINLIVDQKLKEML